MGTPVPATRYSPVLEKAEGSAPVDAPLGSPPTCPFSCPSRERVSRPPQNLGRTVLGGASSRLGGPHLQRPIGGQSPAPLRPVREVKGASS